MSDKGQKEEGVIHNSLCSDDVILAINATSLANCHRLFICCSSLENGGLGENGIGN